MQQKEIPQPKRLVLHPISLIIIIVCIVIGGSSIGLILYAHSYVEKVLPGVSVGDISFAGMRREAVLTYIQERYSKISSDGVRVQFKDKNGGEQYLTVYPTIISKDSVLPFFELNVDVEVEHIFSYGKQKSRLFQGAVALFGNFRSTHLKLQTLKVNEREFIGRLIDELGSFIIPTKNASIEVQSFSPLQFTLTPSSSGTTVSQSSAITQVKQSWERFSNPTIQVAFVEQMPGITEADVKTIVDTLPAVLARAPLKLQFIDPGNKRESSWTITPEMMANWIEVQKNDQDQMVFGLSFASTTDFLQTSIAPKVVTEPQDAKFRIGENNKVTEFQGSRPGVKIQMEATYELLNKALSAATSTVPLSLVVQLVEPKVKTGDVNTLGIVEILGVGYSNFSGSPTNRVKNIRFAVKDKLDGTLIRPGETFSLLSHLRPFTIEGGYLSELVIKGDKIIPEVGGGLCQIGSTMFRAVMNAGFPITERKNHSLVVRYYNDPRNGNPGTDATIYDPAPDFKFVNDSGHHLLLTTDIDTKTGELFFTLWGTNDGRKAYYTKPLVSQWITPGETKKIETTKLEPGKENCQNAFKGAVASFTYVRELVGQEKQEQVFTSHYRALPKICLVGVEKIEEVIPEEGTGTEETPE